LPSPSATVFTSLILLATGVQQAFAQGNGLDHSQNIQQLLPKAAVDSQLDERGWMHLLTPAQDETPSRSCGAAFEIFAHVGPNALKLFYGTNAAYCGFDRCNIVVGHRGTRHSPLLRLARLRRASCLMQTCLMKMET